MPEADPRVISPDMNLMLEDFIEGWETTARRAGAYMPALATLLRIAADELADKHPDDTNGGLRMAYEP